MRYICTELPDLSNKEMGLTSVQRENILEVLGARFKLNMNRHPNLNWTILREKLVGNNEKLWSLHEMELTGGEPDVVDFDEDTGEFVFFDCSSESPSGRRSTCYDREGLESRKQYKPAHNAIEMAESMGIQLLTEGQYRFLQKLGKFDSKTSSWLLTPVEIRDLGGALFGDLRYNRVFIYHNGAQSYYAARGFRGSLRV